jgi:hypothetical protein
MNGRDGEREKSSSERLMTDRGVDDPNNWSIEDLHSSRSVDDILPIHERVMSIYARSSNKDALAIRPLNIFSLAFIMEGLEYHRDNFANLTAPIKRDSAIPRPRKEQDAINKAKHEAAAYINVVGQAFAWVRSVGDNADAPTMEKIYKTFRSKHTAHRSVDARRGETPEELELHLFVFQGLLLNANSEVIFQIQHPVGNSTELNLLQDHQKIVDEFMTVYKKHVQ